MARIAWKKSALAAGLLAMTSSACFGGVVYNVTIDTSTGLSGAPGGIYFQFAPGLNADLASVAIDNFSIDAPGALGTGPTPCCQGDVTGSLDTPPLTLFNTFQNNDYFQFLTYGNRISFRVSFSVPAVLTGDGGSLFGFGVTADDGTPILTTDPLGFLGTIEYDLQGRYTATALSDVAAIQNAAIPEPATYWLIGLGLAGLAAGRRIRKA